MTHSHLPTGEAFLFRALRAWHSAWTSLADAQRIFVERMDLCMGAGVHACACLPVCGSHTCTHACAYSPSSPSVEKGAWSRVAPLLPESSTSCNLESWAHELTLQTQALPGGHPLAGRGLAGRVSLHSFCGGVTLGDKIGWGGKWRCHNPRSLITLWLWGSGKGRSKPWSRLHANHCHGHR